MSSILDEDLLYLIYSKIPEGKVATYGQIARLAGIPKNARLVGKALKYSKLYGGFPCHRIVNYNGRLVPGWDEQIVLLQSEGITFKDNLHVDLKKHLWNM